MADIFKSFIEDYQELNLDSAIKLEIITTEILLRDIKVDDLDIIKWVKHTIFIYLRLFKRANNSL